MDTSLHWIGIVISLTILVIIGLATVNADYELSSGVDCERDCDDNPNPRVCIYNFVLEQYTTLGGACTFCTPNVTNYVVNDCTCVRADGIERSILTANRMIPGPAIFACRGDKIVVDVRNHLEGSETTIHWHGIHQEGSQYSDGVPFVTQCPILYGNTFRYQFWANQSGTFFWHSHSGLQKFNGLAGSIVLKQKRSLEPSGNLYDYDSWRHVVIIQDWLNYRTEEFFPGNFNRMPNQIPTNILINGLGKGVIDGNRTNIPFASFNVTAGSRYRFRLINAFASVCPAAVTIENHNITLIAADGFAVIPVPATTINSMTGERYDFILNANQTVGCYWIQVRGLGECVERGVQQLAVLKYEGSTCVIPETTEPTLNNPLLKGIIINPVDATYNERIPNGVSITYLDNAAGDKDILSLTPNRTFYIPFSIYEVEKVQEFFVVDNYEHFLVNAQAHFLGIMNNISFTQPNAPLLSQYDEVYKENICNYTTCTGRVCHCTNILQLNYGEVVDLYFIDTVDNADLYHPIHIHGVDFFVLGMGYARDLNLTKISEQGVYHASREHRIPMRSKTETCYPILKDTIAIPTNGYAYVRVIANNPGFWFVHCHVDVHISVGMNMVFQIGEPKNCPPVPKKFPTCNDFIGKIDINH